jgi:DNA-binding transcriptional LysR family regulator
LASISFSQRGAPKLRRAPGKFLPPAPRACGSRCRNRNPRLAAPPSISDSLPAPIVVAFQKEYPDVHIQVFITERIVDQIAEGVDLAFRVGELEDSSLVARRILTYRHQLVASPEYLQKNKPPKTPQELLSHRLLAFSFWRPENTWNFIHANGKDRDSIAFKPYLAINEYDVCFRYACVTPGSLPC